MNFIREISMSLPEKDLLQLMLHKIGVLFFSKPNEEAKPLEDKIREKEAFIAKQSEIINRCNIKALPELSAKLLQTRTNLDMILANPGYVITYGGQEGFDKKVDEFKETIATKESEIKLILGLIESREKKIQIAEEEEIVLQSEKIALQSEKIMIDLKTKKDTYQRPNYFLQIQEKLGEEPPTERSSGPAAPTIGP